MANTNQKRAIGILFGVAGGGSIRGESGQKIKEQLTELSKHINLKVSVDAKHFKGEVQKLKKEIEKQLGKLEVSIKANTKQPGGKGGGKGASPESSAYLDAKDALNEYNRASNAKNSKVNQTTKEYEKLSEQLEKAKRNSDKMKAAFESAKDSGAVSDAQIQSIERLNSKVNNATERVEELSKARLEDDKVAKAAAAAHKKEALETSNKGLVANAQELLTRNNKLIKSNKEAAAAAKQLEDIVNEPLPTGDLEKAAEHNRKLANATKDASAKFSELERKTDTLGRKLKETFQSKMLQTFAYALIGIATRALNQVYNNVVKIDTEMTQLRIVTNESEKAYRDYADTVARSAQKIGASITELVNSTTVFARLGYSLKEAATFAEKATMYSKVSGVEIGTATSNITAVVKAFNLGADEVESMLDRMVYVGNNYAISSGEIGEGMNNAASALAANGNTLDQAIGILTAANVTLQNASRSSTAVRTIAARMAGSKTELEELGESADDMLATAKLDEKMRAFGVAVTDANGNLRSTYDVLNDLSKVWDNISNTEQAAIANMLSGNRQQNAFFSIMQNWKDAQSIASESSTAMGALSEAQSEYIDSIQGKTNQLNASWEKFSSTVLDGNLVKSLVDILKTIVDFINGVVSIGGGVIPILVVLSVAFAALSNTITTKFGKDGTEAWLKFVTSIKDGGKSIGIAFKNLAKDPYMYMTLLLTLFLSFANKIPGHAQLIVGAVLLIGTAVSAAVAMADASIKKFMMSNPFGWILLAITAVVTGIAAVVKAIKSFANSSKIAKEKAVEAAKETAEAWKEVADSLENLNGKIEGAYDKIKELQALSDNGKITLVEQNELDKLKHTISELEAEKRLLENIEQLKRKDSQIDASKAVEKILNESISAYTTMDLVDDNGERFTTFIKKKISTDEYLNYLVNNWDSVENLILHYKKSIVELEKKIDTFNIRDYSGEYWETKNAEYESWKTDLSNYRELLRQLENGDPSAKRNAFVSNTLKSLREQKELLTYYTDEDLEQWQIDVNNAYDNYYKFLQKISVAQGEYDDAWNSVISMERFEDVVEFLTDLANKGLATSGYIGAISGQTGPLWEFTNYLKEIGMLAIGSKESFEALVNQINALATSTKGVAPKSYLDILNETQDKFDALSDTLESIEESGIASADSISKLLDKYPSLLKYFKMTSGGYVLSDDYVGMSTDDILNRFATEYLQSYRDELEKCTFGTKEYDVAQDNLNNALAVMATLLRSRDIKNASENLKKMKEALEKQKDGFKDLIDIRKDLLKTYRDEIEYQEELARKQKDVADLRTRLAVARLDNSAAGQARVRELQEELEKAEESLDDFTLEHAIEVLTKNLDNEYKEYEKFIRSEIDRIEQAIKNLSLQPYVKPEIVNKEEDKNPKPEPEDKKPKPEPEKEKPPEKSNKILTEQQFLRGNIIPGAQDAQGNSIVARKLYSSYDNYIDKATTALTKEQFLRGNVIQLSNGTWAVARTQYSSYESYLKSIPTYHSGGTVGGDSYLRNNEEFAKLMKGEFVSTPKQISRFMNETLPTIASGGGVTYNAPLVSIECDSVTKETMPVLQRAIDKAVGELKSGIDSMFSRTGFKKGVNKFSI